MTSLASLQCWLGTREIQLEFSWGYDPPGQRCQSWIKVRVSLKTYLGKHLSLGLLGCQQHLLPCRLQAPGLQLLTFGRRPHTVLFHLSKISHLGSLPLPKYQANELYMCNWTQPFTSAVFLQPEAGHRPDTQAETVTGNA